MTKILTSEKSTLAEAAALRDRMASHRVVGSPLRYIPVVVNGPRDGFMVVELGFATANGLPVIR